jgi:hypothetical protein
MPASEAADQKLSRVQPLKDGKKGGLLGIFFASAFSLPVGTSMVSFSKSATFSGFAIHVNSIPNDLGVIGGSTHTQT